MAFAGAALTAPHPSHAGPRAERSTPAGPHKAYTCTANGPGPAQSRDRGVPPALGAPHAHPLRPRVRRPNSAGADSGGTAREGKRRPGPPAPQGHFNNLSLPSASRRAQRTQNGSCLYIKAPGGRGGGEVRGDLPFPIPPLPAAPLAVPPPPSPPPAWRCRPLGSHRPPCRGAPLGAGLPSRGPRALPSANQPRPANGRAERERCRAAG